MGSAVNGMRGKSLAVVAILVVSAFTLGCLVGKVAPQEARAVAADQPDEPQIQAYARLMDHCESCHSAEGVDIDRSVPTTDFGPQVEQTCTLCHTLERVEAANYDQAGWVALVERMKAKGAPVTDAAEFAKYLYDPSGTKDADKKAGQEPLPDAEGQALVEKICGQCHGLKSKDGTVDFKGRGEVQRYESMKGTTMELTKRDWTATVDRMKNVNECPMTDDEKADIVQWLNEKFR